MNREAVQGRQDISSRKGGNNSGAVKQQFHGDDAAFSGIFVDKVILHSG